MASKRCVIGFDLGTSGCKAVLVSEDGRPLSETQESYPILSPKPGWAEQDPAAWMAAASAAVSRLIRENGIAPEAIAGLALTSAAHIGVLVARDGSPVRPAILWNDQRTVAEVAELEHEAGAEILAATCQAVSTGWTLPHLRWIRRHDPVAWSRTAAVLLSKDYLVKQWTGRAVTDPATALSAQLADGRTGQWSPRLCELAGIRPDMLPEIRDAGATAGGLTAPAAGGLGLKTGTPVIVGTLDSATELLAAGLCEPGGGLVRLATAGGVERVVGGPIPNRHRITYPHPVGGAWYAQAGTSTCAAAVQWGLRLFGPDLSYEAWDAAAAAVPPGSGGLLFHPYLAGERAPHWDPSLKGSLVGFSLGHTRGHVARAIYEGTAFSIRQAMTVLDDIPHSGQPLAVVGGGVKSRLWIDILAAVLDRPLRVVECADSALGAALIGLAGLGLQADLKTLVSARALSGRPVSPSPDLAAFYQRQYASYVEGHRVLSPFYKSTQFRLE